MGGRGGDPPLFYFMAVINPPTPTPTPTPQRRLVAVVVALAGPLRYVGEAPRPSTGGGGQAQMRLFFAFFYFLRFRAVGPPPLPPALGRSVVARHSAPGGQASDAAPRAMASWAAPTRGEGAGVQGGQTHATHTTEGGAGAVDGEGALLVPAWSSAGRRTIW